MRGFQSCEYKEWNTNTEKIKWKNCDVLMVININKSITIYDAPELRFDLIKNYPSVFKNEQQIIKFDAVDDEGLKCKVSVFVFMKPEGIHRGTVIVEYSNYFLAYRLKANE